MNDIKQKPDNFLTWSILSTAICCMPSGIVAIIYANKVDALWGAGKYDEAEDAAKKAKMWTLIGVGAAAVAFLFSMFLLLIIAIIG